MGDQKRAGEVLIKTPGMMLGYANDLAAMTAFKEGDWFRTGDIGYCCDDKWYIIDRAKV